MKCFINKITKNLVTMSCAEEWEIIDGGYAAIGHVLELTLPVSDTSLIDKLVSLYKDCVELTVKEGKITAVTKVEVSDEDETPNVDLIMTGKPKSLRDRLQVVLGAIVELEKETLMVQKSRLLQKLEQDCEIAGPDAERLLGHLQKEGTIYSPKEGYLKKT